MPAVAPHPTPLKTPSLTIGTVLAVGVLTALIASWYKDTRSVIFPFFGPTSTLQATAMNGHMRETEPTTRDDFDSAPSGKSADSGHPNWTDLTEYQQAILQGLHEVWPFYSNAEKRRWLATAHSARSLSPEQQSTMATQIAQWSKLSEVQRMEMRLLFEEQSEETKANAQAAWLAYNQLSEAEKHQLTRQALGTTGAQTGKPKSPPNSRLVRIPAASQARQQLANLPKIQPAAAKAAPLPAPHGNTQGASSAPENDAGDSRQYRWGNIIVTPPDPLPPLYRN